MHPFIRHQVGVEPTSSSFADRHSYKITRPALYVLPIKLRPKTAGVEPTSFVYADKKEINC